MSAPPVQIHWFCHVINKLGFDKISLSMLPFVTSVIVNLWRLFVGKKNAIIHPLSNVYESPFWDTKTPFIHIRYTLYVYVTSDRFELWYIVISLAQPESWYCLLRKRWSGKKEPYPLKAVQIQRMTMARRLVEVLLYRLPLIVCHKKYYLHKMVFKQYL